MSVEDTTAAPAEPPRRGAPPAEPPSPQERELVGDEAADGGQDASAEPATAAVEPLRTVVPRWVQLVLLPLALLALWALARASGKLLLVFVVAGVIALILNPAVAFLQRSRLPPRPGGAGCAISHSS